MNRRATCIATLSALSLTITLSVNTADGTESPRSVTLPAGVTVPDQAQTSYIVQASSLAAARAAVQAAGGTVTHELGIINAVAALLAMEQLQALEARNELTLFKNRGATLMGTADPGPPSEYVIQTGADQLHAQGITGLGVTVAILDTGTANRQYLNKDAAGNFRLKVQYDAIANTTSIPSATNPVVISDGNGHGTHVQSIISNRRQDVNGKYNGMAPNVNVVSVKAFDTNGHGNYANVIRGLDWVLANKAAYNIRLLNLSFGATPQSNYRNDPLNKAVMRLWQAGVIVVASAGNWGPYAQSISVPGNNPYVITVGAVTDNYTPANLADDRLASFSGSGPTHEGFVKPEIVAPGGHIVGVMSATTKIPTDHPEFQFSYNGLKQYFTMSGTSQAAAVTTGAVALMLQAQPSLTPDQVKCKLMSSAGAAIDGSGKLAYTVFQQGAGQMNAYAAVHNPYTSCGNLGLDIAADLEGTKQFGGPARKNANGSYYIVDASGNTISDQGYIWNNGYLWNQGYLWSNGYLWSQGYIWSQGYLWNNGYVWNNGTLWNQNFVPSTNSVSAINHWVDQE